jgi:hypothetical protein
VLLPRAVHERAQFQSSDIFHIVGVDEPGAEHRAAVAILHAQVRAIVVFEVVADRVVVGDHVAGHMPHGVLALDVPRGLPDHDGQLALVVHERDIGGAARDAAMTDHRAGSFEKHERLVLLVELQFLRMPGVVQAEREDRADFDWCEPDHFILATHAAIGEAHAIGVRIGFVNRACIRNTAAHHGCSPACSFAPTNDTTSDGNPPIDSVAVSPI